MTEYAPGPDGDPEEPLRPWNWYVGRCANCRKPLDDHCHLHGRTNRPVCPAGDGNPPCGPTEK